jgi:hypothetical protein
VTPHRQGPEAASENLRIGRCGLIANLQQFSIERVFQVLADPVEHQKYERNHAGKQRCQQSYLTNDTEREDEQVQIMESSGK